MKKLQTKFPSWCMKLEREILRKKTLILSMRSIVRSRAYFKYQMSFLKKI